MTQPAVVAAVIAGCVALVVAVIGAAATYFSSKRQQKRATYSEAVRAATVWTELLYRVRRRLDGNESAMEIVSLFHQAQENLQYYKAWVGAESEFMARSYKKLVVGVKSETEQLIQEAWADEVRPVPGNARPDDKHPSVDGYVAEFLRDVRASLSPWPWRKMAIWARNWRD